MRGRVDLIINGSYWLGAAAGSAAAIVLLDESLLAADVGWRIAFALGVVLGLAILLVRRHVPESPRWLFIHGREEEAERIVDRIESDVADETGQLLSEPEESITVRQRESVPFREIAKVAVKTYPARSFLALALFVGQAFIYNGVTFNLGTLFTSFYGISSGFVPVFLIVFAVGNFLGPLTLGRLFDTVGRKPMIIATYVGSAAITAITAALFAGSTLSSAWALEGLIIVTFFLASAGASAAYLTASEIFPMETRALAIAFFYAAGTAAGGIAGPLLFGHLIDSGSRSNVAIAFWIGAAVMAVGGVAELFFGVRAEQESLEDIAKPLTAEEAEEAEVGEREGAAGEERPEGREWPEARRARRQPSREADRRIRERVEQRRRRERAGLRRYRPGLGSSFYSPGMIGTAYRSRSDTGELARNREIDSIVSALEEHGPSSRSELARLVGARYWGPGRFRRALGDAVGEGHIRPVGGSSYEAVTSGEGDGDGRHPRESANGREG